MSSSPTAIAIKMGPMPSIALSTIFVIENMLLQKEKYKKKESPHSEAN